MTTKMTTKGQITIPERIRDALCLVPGDGIDFHLNEEGEVIITKAVVRPKRPLDRFQSARGKAQVQWRTDELLALLRDAE